MPARPPLLLALLLVAPLLGCSIVDDVRGTAADNGCPDVQVVGVRGQAQSVDANRGLGTEVDQVVAALESDLAERGVDDVTVTALRHDSRDAADLGVYDADVTAGRELLDAVLRTRVEECPDARLVVVGFSQGAQIAQESLAAAPGLAEQVDALGLLGSPRHDPGSDITHLDLPGPAATNTGSLGAGPDLGGLAARTVDACLSRDVVCDADGGTDLTVHKTGYEDPAIGREVAGALAALIPD